MISTPSNTSQVTEMITRHYRGLIRTGHLATGARLPSTQNLADSWATHAPIVQEALTPLVKEGLLQRKRGLGTVVLDVPPRLSRIGILTANGMQCFSSDYYRLLNRKLVQQIEGGDRECHMFHHDDFERPEDVCLPEELVTAANERQIEALVVPMTGVEEVRLFSKLPLPVSAVTGANVPFRVQFDYIEAAQLAMGRLKAAGCRSVGIIAPRKAEVEHAAEISEFCSLHHHNIRMTAAALGLELVDEHFISRRFDNGKWDPQRFGYQSVQHLWQQETPPPDGLLVMEDWIARGALTGLLHLGVDIPGQLHFACYQNRDLDMFCPVPATFVEWDVAELASLLIQQVETQFAGETVQPLLLPPHIRDYQPDTSKE